MKKTLILLLTFYGVLFVLSWLVYPDVSVIPLGGLTGASLCALFYIIDKWGFDEINTIDLCRTDGNFYNSHLRIYAGLLAIGHGLAWYGLQ